MKPLALPTVALIAGLTGACATTPTPAPETPYTVPLEWSITHPDTVLGTTASHWWQQFDDPQLDDLVAEALRQSPTLGAAAARLSAALAQAGIAGADRQPQLGGALDSARRRQNFIGLPIPGLERDVLSNTSTTQGLSVEVAWEVDLWGRLRAGRGAALASAEAAEVDVAAVRLALVGEVAKAWYAWLEANEQVTLAVETLDNRRQTREQIESRYSRGLREALDLRLALASEADARARLAERRQNADGGARRLEILLTRYPSGESLPATATLPEITSPPATGQPAELVTRRPDLISAELRLAASGLDVKAARAALYPQLRLTGSVGRSSAEIADLLDNDFSVWSLAAGLLQPLFQGGRLRSAVDLAEARRQEAAHNYLSAALTAFGDVEKALAAERFLAQRLAALADATRQSLAARDLAERRYRSGLSDYLAVLESQRQATLNQSLLVLVRRQRLDSRIELHLALGGDYDTGAEAPAGAARESS